MIKAMIGLLGTLQRTPALLKLFSVRPKRVSAFSDTSFLNSPPSTQETVWFHAASLGELEMLRALIEDFKAAGQKVGVTCFSDSASDALDQLKSECVFAGLSPAETEWETLFIHFKVCKLIISKYDLWPGMAFAAEKLQIPVILINARPGRSLSVLKNLFSSTFAKLPRIFFFALTESDQKKLQKRFTESQVDFSVDPRFERVARRIESSKTNSKAKLWLDQINQLQKPIGMIGSAWMEDLEVVLQALKNSNDSLVVVPHDLSASNLTQMKICLEEALPGRYLLVNEMGVLVELYAGADWAFVGGGFGKGIHSTLEPSLFHLPVSCGPARVQAFPETIELTSNNILTVCRNTDEFSKWLKQKSHTKISLQFLDFKRKQYRALLEECLRIR